MDNRISIAKRAMTTLSLQRGLPFHLGIASGPPPEAPRLHHADHRAGGGQEVSVETLQLRVSQATACVAEGFAAG